MKELENRNKFLLATLLACLVLFTGCSASGKGEVAAPVSDEEEVSIVKGVKKEKEGNSLVLYLGENKSLPVSEEEGLHCKSADASVATVSEQGVVHGMKAGKTEITAVTADGEETYHITVKKRGMVYPSFSMMKGEHLDMQFSQPGIQAKEVSWKSSKPSVATVSKGGRVTAGRKGAAIITGKAGKNIYTCNLKVTKKVDSIIYLTFDDGPNRYTTPKILKILKKNNVKATFFELKPAKKDFDLTERVLAEGHSLAMHGYQHKYDIIYRSVKIYRNNLDKLQELFFKKFGVWCTVSRFPGGSSNMVSRYNPGVMTRITGQIHGWGYHYFDWNVDSGDAGGSRNADDVYRNVTGGLVKGRGNVVLMHDYTHNDKTVDALDRIIKYGKKNGYTFMPITASTAEVHHGVNN